MALDFEESKQNCEERPTTVLFIVFENMKVKKPRSVCEHILLFGGTNAANLVIK